MSKQPPIQHLRVSITPRCNYNCFICDHEGVDTSGEEMQPDELVHLIRLFVEELGISRIKFTGGEPLCYPYIEELIRDVKLIPGVDDLSLTTNGFYLEERTEALKHAGLDRINISIWSLKPDIYAKITNSDSLDKVLAGLEVVKRFNFSQVKLNYTLLRNYNVDEFWDIYALARDHGFILQLIELHKVEGINPDIIYDKEHFDVRDLERKFLPLVEKTHNREIMQARKVYYLQDDGIIEAVVMGPDACAHCTKIRLTHDGNIKPCLLRNESNVDLLGKLRSGASDVELRETIHSASLTRRPYYNFDEKECQNTL